MKSFKNKNLMYTIAIIVICAAIIVVTWLFGDEIFFQANSKQYVGRGGLTIYKTEENYENKNFSNLVKDGVLHIADCGAIPNATYDYGALFRSAIQTCLDTGARLKLEEGIYYCSPEEGTEFLFDCSDLFADGFVLEGNGATIINTDSFSGFFKFAESKDITISGMNFDYFYEPWVQAEVVSYDEDTNELALMVESEHCIFDDARYMNSIEDIFGVIRNRKNPRLIDDERLNYFRIASVKKVMEKGYAVTLGADTIAYGTQFSEGDKVTLNNRKNAGYSIFDIRTCGDVKLSDINAYSANGCLVLGAFMTGDVSLDNVNILYGNHDERWITTNSDGVHMQASSGKLIMNNCRFEGLADDGVNLYQAATVITEVISDDTFIIDGTTWGTYVSRNVGETLIFYDHVNGIVLGEAKVVATDSIEGSWGNMRRKISVDKPIAGIVVGSDRAYATHVYIKESAFCGSTITNCAFENIRGRGLVLRANDCTVRDSTFTNISNHAIYVGNWTYEGAYTNGLAIVNNVIENCGYNHIEANSYNAASLGIYMENYSQSAQLANPAHSNIEIRGNTISKFHGRAIMLGNVSGAVIAENLFRADAEHHAYARNETVYINESADVKVENNTFEDNTETITGSVVYEQASTSGVHVSDNTFALSKEQQIVKE